MTLTQLLDLKPGDRLEWRPGDFCIVREIHEWPTHPIYGETRYVLADDVQFPGGGFTYGGAVTPFGAQSFPKLLEA